MSIRNTSQSFFKGNHPQTDHRKMTDPYFADMKQHKRDADWLYACAYANYYIPKKCTCGGAIVVETDDRGRNYYVCKVFEVRFEVNLFNLTTFLSKQIHLYLFLLGRWVAHPT